MIAKLALIHLIISSITYIPIYFVTRINFFHMLTLYYISQLIIYFVHRIPHQLKKPTIWYNAHVIGHHLKNYHPMRFDSEKYLYKTDNLFYEPDTYVYILPLFVFYFFYNFYILQLKWKYYTLIVGMLLFHVGIDIYIHKQVHLKNSFLNKFSLFQKIKELHKIHHTKMKKNYSFTNLVFDYIFGTYEE